MIMNFWKVLMESITAKQRQKGQNVRMGTQWFDVSQDTSKVVVPMAHLSQHGTEIGVHEQTKDLVESESDQSNTISVLSGRCTVQWKPLHDLDEQIC